MKNSIIIGICITLISFSCDLQNPTNSSSCLKHDDCNSGFCLEGKCQIIAASDDDNLGVEVDMFSDEAQRSSLCWSSTRNE